MTSKGQRLPAEERIKQVKDCLASGLSVKKWCEQNDVSIKTIYYWKRCVEAGLDNQGDNSWVDLTSSKTATCTALAISEKTCALSINRGDFKVEIVGAVDEENLCRVLRVVGTLC